MLTTIITSLLRAMAMVAISIGLTGCNIYHIHTSSLEVNPPERDDATLLRSVAYVVHRPAPHRHAESQVVKITDQIDEHNADAWAESEAKSWINALSGFADRKNIYVQEDGNPAALPAPFLEFSGTHPVVHVRLKDTTDWGFWKVQSKGIRFFVSVISLGIIPASDSSDISAEFVLSMPDQKVMAPTKLNFAFHRYEYSSPMPFYAYYADSISKEVPTLGVTARYDHETDITDWQAEEMRRLILQFLRDAAPLLRSIRPESLQPQEDSH